jgi:hypothetical protein
LSTLPTFAPVHLIVVRSVSEHGVIGKQAHHHIEVLAWEDAAGGVEYDLYIADREDVRRRAAVPLRRGEDWHAQQQSNNVADLIVFLQLVYN